METLTFYTQNAAETEALGAAFAKTLHAGDFVALYGDLGVGKTAFVRGAMQVLAPDARVQSPTYTIVNEYPGKIPVYHFDMYRIEDEDSLYSIGFYDYIAGIGICFSEWSEKIINFLPEDALSVRIEKNKESPDTRLITITRGK